jgi:DNA-binding transcriptional LysR family regulator
MTRLSPIISHQIRNLERERYPEVRVSLAGGTSAPLLALVAHSRLDAAIVARPQEGLPGPLASTPVLSDQIVALVSPGSPLAGAGTMSLRDVPADRIIRDHVREDPGLAASPRPDRPAADVPGDLDAAP